MKYFSDNRFSKLKVGKFPSPEQGLRAMVDRAPQAEAFAASWIERFRPLGMTIYALRRRIATIAVGVIAAALFAHVMLGANGMVVYKQKRAEREALQKQIVQMQKENDLYTQKIQGLQSDQKAIEREAREELRYARPGEVVYVTPAPPPVAPANHSAKR